MSREPVQCDHCRQPVHADRNGWWVGADETSECDSNAEGHEVDGYQRA